MNKLYIVCREDLPLAYAMVQGGHSIGSFFMNNPAQTWNNETLIYVGVKDEKELKMLCRKLTSRCIEFNVFHEPQLNGQLTSIACHCTKPVPMLEKLKNMGDVQLSHVFQKFEIQNQ